MPSAPDGNGESIEETLLVGGDSRRTDLEAPTSIGPYHLVHCIGRGGMGEVWLAEQLEPVRRQVALKIIKAGMDTKEVVARFESERQALAMMDHPAIAKVFDGGSTPEGRPYFVMEYVAGLPITEYCDSHQLSVPERLELFCQVCDGVQHAHQKAIIHRDLKPSNLLVTEVGGKAMPKIIDFGIAKATGYRLTEKTLFTELGAVLGTPEYMSPEQAEVGGQDVDTRTDIYSLGVVLYQLLTGELPFPSRELRSSGFEEIRRRLRETEPPSPSTRLSTLGDSAEEVARRRRTEPAALRRQLIGDLDAIILKALEKERTRRYGTTAELSADIERHLRHEPVEAQPPSATYRAAKYLRRHRVAVSVASVIGLLLIAFAVTAALQARRTARERDRANAEAAAARQVTQFLTSMFRVSDPIEAQGSNLSARELLDRGAREIETALPEQPELGARLTATIAEVYKQLGLYPQAEGLARSALATRTRVLGPEAAETLDSMSGVASILREEGKSKDAEALVRQSLAITDRTLGPRSPAALRQRSLLSVVLAEEGDYATAEPMARETLTTMRQVLAPDDRAIFAHQQAMVTILGKQSKWAEGEAMSREMLTFAEARLGLDHPDTLLSLSNLAAEISNQGRPAEAVPLMRDLIVREKRVFGLEHHHTLLALTNLALTLKWLKQLDEAARIEGGVVSTERQVLGPEHPQTLEAMSILALIWKDQKQYDDAERVARQVLDVRSRVLGANHPDTAEARYNVACILARAGRTDEALKVLADALEHGLRPHAEAGIGRDSDFASLHGNPRFEELAAEGQARAARAEEAMAGPSPR